MRKWYDDWGVWLIAVATLIGLGVLLGHDLVRYEGVASTLNALGTLMLGFAAIVGVSSWRAQERYKFQATFAAEFYSKLYPLARTLQFEAYMYELKNNDCKPPTSQSEDGKWDAQDESLAKALSDLSSALRENVLPQSALIGRDFHAKVEALLADSIEQLSILIYEKANTEALKTIEAGLRSIQEDLLGITSLRQSKLP